MTIIVIGIVVAVQVHDDSCKNRGMRDLNGFEDSASKKTGEHADSLEVSTEQLLDGLHLG